MSRNDQPRPAVPRTPPRGPTPPNAGAPPVEPAALVALSEQYGVPAVDASMVAFPLTNLDLIPIEIARRHVVVPIVVRDDAICLATADPGDRRVLEELEFVSGRRVYPYVAAIEQLKWLIEYGYAAHAQGESNYAGARAGSPGAAVPTVGQPVAGSVSPASAAASTPDLSLDDEDVAEPELGGDSVPRRAIPTLDSVFSALDAVQGRTILVVDDEEDIRKLLRRVLEERRYRVLEADRGSVALAMVKKHMPDAIVLDAMLPELHGFDICRRIKASARYGHIPILMVSAVYRGWRFAEDLKSAYGVNAYIEKPFRIADIVSAVEGMLAGAPKADGRNPDALTAEAEAALAAGMEAYRLGNVDSAIVQLEQAIKLDPLSYRLHYHLALLVGRKGDVFRAIQELETAVDLHPESFAALKNLAVLYQKAGFKHKAIEIWERAIGQSPDDETKVQIKDHLMSLL